MGRHGVSHDISANQAPTLLIEKDIVLLTQPEIDKMMKLHDMATWQCAIILTSDANNRPLENPLSYAMLFNNLQTVSDWIATGEVSVDGIFHVHVVLKTTSRTDSIKRAIRSAWLQLSISDGFIRMYGQDPQVDCLKLQKCYRPSSMFAYCMKDPIWVCSNKDQHLELLHGIAGWGYNERFKHKDYSVTPPANPEVNQMTKEIVDAIIMCNAKTFDDLLRAAPETMQKYLHRHGLQGIVQNCLAFVRATSGGWSMQLYERFEPDPSIIHKILLHQGIQPTHFDEIFWIWITKQHSKKNTICLQGPSNTGKSAFISGLKQIVPWGEIVNTNTFAFEGILECIIAVWEEPLCSAELAEKAKQVLEGMPTSVPVKYKKPQMLPRTPVLITTNHDLWRFCSKEEEMFKNRMWIINWNYECNNQPFTFRTREYGCECAHCRASCCSSASDGEPGPCRMPASQQPISTRKQLIRDADDDTEMGSGSLSDPGEGTSRCNVDTSSGQTSSTDQRSTDSTRLRSSSSSPTSRSMGYGTTAKSCDTGNRNDSSESSDEQSLESNNSPRSHGNVSKYPRTTKSRQHQLKRNTRGTRSNIREHDSTTVIRMLGKTKKETKKISIRTKKQRLGGSLDTLNETLPNIPLHVPLPDEWQQYLSFLQHTYG